MIKIGDKCYKEYKELSSYEKSFIYNMKYESITIKGIKYYCV